MHRTSNIPRTGIRYTTFGKTSRFTCVDIRSSSVFRIKDLKGAFVLVQLAANRTLTIHQIIEWFFVRGHLEDALGTTLQPGLMGMLPFSYVLRYHRITCHYTTFDSIPIVNMINSAVQKRLLLLRRYTDTEMFVSFIGIVSPADGDVS